MNSTRPPHLYTLSGCYRRQLAGRQALLVLLIRIRQPHAYSEWGSNALLRRIEQTDIAGIVALLSSFGDEMVTLAALTLAERLLAERATTPEERTAPCLALSESSTSRAACHGVFQVAAETVLNGPSFPLP
jgi:hypothetical protein